MLYWRVKETKGLYSHDVAAAFLRTRNRKISICPLKTLRDMVYAIDFSLADGSVLNRKSWRIIGLGRAWVWQELDSSRQSSSILFTLEVECSMDWRRQKMRGKKTRHNNKRKEDDFTICDEYFMFLKSSLGLFHWLKSQMFSGHQKLNVCWKEGRDRPRMMEATAATSECRHCWLLHYV